MLDIHTVLIALHLLGFAFGVGGATASDMTFIRSTKDGEVTRSEFRIIKTLSILVWASVTLLIISGILLMGLEYHETGSWERITWSWFQLKITAYAALVVNGIVFHNYVFPLLGSSVGSSFRSEVMRSKYKLFALTGAVSIVSWYTAFLSVPFSDFLIQFPYLLLLNVYVLLILGGALSAYTVLHMHADAASPFAAARSVVSHRFAQGVAVWALILTMGLLVQIFAYIN